MTFGEVFLEEAGEELVFGTRQMSVRFNRHNGFCGQMTNGMTAINVPPGPVVDIKLGETWLSETEKLRFAGYETCLRGSGSSPRPALCLTFQAGSEFTLKVDYEISPDEALILVSACLQRAPSSGKPLRLESFRFKLGPLVIGRPADCMLDAPGPFPTYGLGEPFYLPPHTPLERLAGVDTPVGSAPDWGPGILSIGNTLLGLTLGAWMDTHGEVNYLPILQSDGQQATFAFEDLKSTWLRPGESACSDILYVSLAANLPETLANYRRMAEETMPLAAGKPGWVEDMVILEAMPQAYGGFNGLRERLPDYADMGINTLYLMPHWLGGYGNLDPFAVDPSLGTPEDLRVLVQRAHGLGMRVLFDMVIHGFDKDSPLLTQQPEMFFHNEDGSLAYHPLWGTISTDWVNPVYQQYMQGLVRHHIQDYGVDGYRLDAASFKGANWDPHLPYPAYRSGCAALELIGLMMKAGRQLKPEFIIMNEVFGPAFYAACDLTHDNMTMGPQIFLERLERGEAQVADYKQHIGDIYAALPKGASRVFFARNHDTSWFYHFNGYTPAFFSLDAVHAFFGIPEIFGGDPNHGPNPEETPGLFNFYKKIWQVRRSMPALTHGEITLREVTCDCPQVFSGARLLGKEGVLVVISFSEQPEEAAVSLELPAPWQTRDLFDVLTGEAVPWTPRPQGISLVLEPFQVLVGRLVI